MKDLNKMLNSFFALVLCVSLWGCTKENPVTAPSQPNAGQTVQFIEMPATPLMFYKHVAATESVTVKHGGKLELKYEQKDADGKTIFELSVELKFDKNSISDDFMASLSMDPEYLMTSVNLQFGPHGVEFLEPAKLKIHVKGLNLAGFTDKDVLYLYYDNNGTWERMEGSVRLHVHNGEITCDNGRVPHFSRYAFGR